MSNEVVKFSNKFNGVILRKFDATHLDVLMSIASRVRDRGTEEVTFDFSELRRMMQLKKNLTDEQLAKKIVGMNARLLALNYTFVEHGEIVQFALFTEFRTNPGTGKLTVSINRKFAFLLNELTSQFTRFELAEFTGLKSRYSKEFYRRAKQYRSSGVWRIGRDEFCRLLDVPASATTPYLNNKVLKPILQEVGPLMHLKINRQYTHRKLTGFTFTFARETPPSTTSGGKLREERTPTQRNPDFTESDIQRTMRMLGSEEVTDTVQIIAMRKRAIGLLHEYGSVGNIAKAISFG